MARSKNTQAQSVTKPQFVFPATVGDITWANAREMGYLPTKDGHGCWYLATSAWKSGDPTPARPVTPKKATAVVHTVETPKVYDPASTAPAAPVTPTADTAPAYVVLGNYQVRLYPDGKIKMVATH